MNENFTLRFASKNEIDLWDTCVLQNKHQAGFLQSKAYADTKMSFGWNVRFVVYSDGYENIYAYFLEKRIPLIGYLWYMPSGSLGLRQTGSFLHVNKEFIKEHGLPVFLIKVEPKIIDTPYVRRTLTKLKLQKAKPIQAHSSTILLDLRSELPDSLAPKARRDIRLASKQEIEVRQLPFSNETGRVMYQLMKTVNRGKGSSFIRPYEYYRVFWSNFSKNNHGKFYFAFENNRPVVGAFVINFGDMSTYKDGGSTPNTIYKKRYSMAIQWQALLDARRHGSLSYDLCGVPQKQDLYNPTHHYYGIGQFKLKFKKETIDYCGCYDQALKPLSYKCWNALEKIIYRFHLIKYNDLFF